MKFPVQYARILLKLTNDTTAKELDATMRTYVQYLKDEQALSKVPYIIEEYVRLAHETAGTSPLEVITAHPLTAASKKKIESEFGGTIASVTVDPDLVGGIVVRKGNVILNSSISKQLELLANSMK